MGDHAKTQITPFEVATELRGWLSQHPHQLAEAFINSTDALNTEPLIRANLSPDENARVHLEVMPKAYSPIACLLCGARPPSGLNTNAKWRWVAQHSVAQHLPRV